MTLHILKNRGAGHGAGHEEVIEHTAGQKVTKGAVQTKEILAEDLAEAEKENIHIKYKNATSLYETFFQ